MAGNSQIDLGKLLKMNGAPCTWNEHDSFKKFVPKTVVIVGNGAIRNGELPLKKPLNDFIREFAKNAINQDRAATLKSLPYSYNLSLIANWTKMIRELIFLEIREFTNPTPGAQKRVGSIMVRQELIDQLNELIDFRVRLGESYNDHAVEELSIREVPSALKTILENDKDSAFVTTNWDNTLWRAQWARNCIYLHGRCEFPLSIILPSEYSDYGDIPSDIASHYRQNKKKYSKAVIEILNRMYAVHGAAISQLHRGAIDWFQSADTLVFWGIALNAYDVEIFSLLSNADHRGKKKSVVCINTDGAAMANAAKLVGSLEYRAILPDID